MSGRFIVGGTAVNNNEIYWSEDPTIVGSWTRVSNAIEDGSGFIGMKCVGVGGGVALLSGYNGVMRRSTDGGSTWSNVPNPGWSDGSVDSAYNIPYSEVDGVFMHANDGSGNFFSSDGLNWTKGPQLSTP